MNTSTGTLFKFMHRDLILIATADYTELKKIIINNILGPDAKIIIDGKEYLWEGMTGDIWNRQISFQPNERDSWVGQPTSYSLEIRIYISEKV